MSHETRYNDEKVSVMSISLDLDDKTAARVESAARRAGMDVPTFLQVFVGRSFTEDRTPTRSVEEILAPFRNEVFRSGLNDTELDAVFSEARERRYQAKQKTGE